MIRVAAVGAALLCLTAALRSDDPKDSSKEPPSKAAQAYEALIKEYDDAFQEFLKARKEAKTEEEIKKADEKYPQPEKFASRFLNLAKKHSKDAAAVDALVWVAGRVGTAKEGLDAINLLVKEHIDDPKIAQVCQSLAYQEGKEAEDFLKAVLEKSKDHNAKGQACYALALHAKDRAATATEKKDPEAGKLSKDVEAMFEKMGADFADVKSYQGTLGDVAKAELFEIRNLSVGMTVPEIEGEDIDGGKMKLSDFRGKVVLLDFWGNW